MKLGKKIIGVLCMDFALITLYYGNVSRFRHDYCMYALLIFVAGIIASLLLRNRMDFPMWAISLIVGAICCFGLYTSSGRINTEENKETAAVSTPDEPNAEPVEYSKRISSLSDIGNSTINKLNEYAADEIEASISGLSRQDTTYCKAAKMLENATGGPRYEHFFATDNGYKNVNSKKISLRSIVLCTPKDERSKKGYIKLNYRINIDFTWGNAYTEEFHNFNEPIYVSMVWIIDVDNPEHPIEDYGKFLFDSTNSDTDYDNWYNKNVIAEKRKYEIEEKLMK